MNDEPLNDARQVVIRRAGLEDLGIIQELNFGSFRNDQRHDRYLVMDWPFDPATGGAYFSSRLSGSGAVFIAEKANQAIGYLAGAMQPNESYRQGSRSELENMFVSDSARREGVGTALVTAFVEWSREQGADEVFVSAYFGNDRAVSFYQENDFRSYSHSLLLDLRPKHTS